MLWSISAIAADSHQDAWLKLIAATTGCEAKLLRVETRITGNNGMISEGWVVSSCKGEQKYRVDFWPHQYFPKYKSEHLVYELK